MVTVLSDRAGEVAALEALRGDRELAQRLLDQVIDRAKEKGVTDVDVRAFVQSGLSQLLDAEDHFEALDREYSNLAGKSVFLIENLKEYVNMSELPAGFLPSDEELSKAFSQIRILRSPVDKVAGCSWWVHTACLNAPEQKPEDLKLISFDDQVDIICVLRRLRARKLRPATPREAVAFDVRYRSVLHEDLHVLAPSIVCGVTGDMTYSFTQLMLYWTSSQKWDNKRKKNLPLNDTRGITTYLDRQVSGIDNSWKPNNQPERADWAKYAFLVAPL